jgi:hypothetical protein
VSVVWGVRAARGNYAVLLNGSFSEFWPAARGRQQPLPANLFGNADQIDSRHFYLIAPVNPENEQISKLVFTAALKGTTADRRPPDIHLPTIATT